MSGELRSVARARFVQRRPTFIGVTCLPLSIIRTRLEVNCLHSVLLPYAETRFIVRSGQEVSHATTSPPDFVRHRRSDYAARGAVHGVLIRPRSGSLISGRIRLNSRTEKPETQPQVPVDLRG